MVQDENDRNYTLNLWIPALCKQTSGSISLLILKLVENREVMTKVKMKVFFYEMTMQRKTISLD